MPSNGSCGIRAGSVSLSQYAVPSGSDLPPWLDDLTPEDVAAGGGGVSFVEGEAYVDGVLINDLSEVFIGYQPSRKTVEGYDFGNVSDTHFLEWETNLLALVASMNLAFRVEFRLRPDANNVGLVAFTNAAGEFGADAFMFGGLGGDTLSVYDWSGDNVTTGVVINANTWYVLASSNNAEGWRTTVNGAPTVLDPTQTVGDCNRVTVGAAAGDVFHLSGHIKKLTFRPNGMNDAELRAWATG